MGTSPQVAADGSIVSINAGSIIRRAANGALAVVAGGGTSWGDGVPATDADLTGATALAFDPAGNLYVSIGGVYAIREVDLGGIITAITGAGPGPSAATAAPRPRPPSPVSALATDPAGNLFLAGGVSGNERVRRIDAGGTITTITGGLATPERASRTGRTPTVACSEYQGHTVRRIEGDGSKTTIAGTGNPGFSGDGGPASAAQLNRPHGLGLRPDRRPARRRPRRTTGCAASARPPCRAPPPRSPPGPAPTRRS